MDKVIARATDSINHILESSSQSLTDKHKSLLVDIRNMLNQLPKRDSPINDWTQLFCRELNRLMDCNNPLIYDFWLARYVDTFCALKEPNGGQDKNNIWERFLERMNFERKLQQREIQFQQTFKERKSLKQLFSDHKGFLEEYLKKCLLFHSKVQVRGLVQNINDLIGKVYGLTEVSLTSESRKCLKNNLKCIELNFDCSNRSFQRCGLQSAMYDNSFKRVNNSLENFLPSLASLEMRQGGSYETIANMLQSNRWIVILGDPGSAKTTLLRWITRTFSEAILCGKEEVILNDDNRLPIRIPILIRIGEFAAWLDHHRTKTLIDYIGEHTWFSEHYCCSEGESALKELIYHGHALILLDGLDEISEVGRRGEIVELVRKFVDEYIHAADFFSAFDGTLFSYKIYGHCQEVVETQLPNKSGGNQIIVTSRIVGYQLHPLHGALIDHYILLLMDRYQANDFAKQWIIEVEKSVFDILLNEGIKIDAETINTLSKRRDNAVQAMFKEDSEVFMQNPFLLSLICTFIFQLSDEFHPKSRVEVYNHAFQAVVHSWRSQESIISESLLTNFLIDLATYLHLYSASGLIDAFDMEHLCCLTLKQQHLSNDHRELRKCARDLISLLDTNVGIVAERGLQIFGFLHLSFQEYFVAQSLVKESSVDKITERILSFTIHPQFRESLLLAVGWISWKWSSDDYNKFCNLLVTPNNNYVIPVGTLLLFDALNDLQRYPSKSVVYTALNNLLDQPFNIVAQTYLIPNLLKIHKTNIEEWMQLYLKDEKRLLKFCECLVTKPTRTQDLNQTKLNIALPMICQQLWSLQNISALAEFIIDQTLRKIVTSDNVPDSIFNNELSSYISSHDICASTIHPLILSVIIAVGGGVYLNKEEHTIKIHFSLKQIHRESSILASIMKNFIRNEESHSIQVHILIKQYDDFLQQCLPTDTSLEIVDTFIALICLQGLSKPLIYEKYDGYQALPLALDRLKRTWFHFMKSCEPFRYNPNVSFIRSEVESIINFFFSQSTQSNEQHDSFSTACVAALKKLRIPNLTCSFKSVYSSCNNDDDRFNRYQLESIGFICKRKSNEIAQSTNSLYVLKEETLFTLTFIPESLQKLYECTTNSPTNNAHSLPFVVFLSQCLTHLEDFDMNDSNSCHPRTMLQQLLKEHMLESYALVLFREKYSNTESLNDNLEEFSKEMRDHKLSDSFLIDEGKRWKIPIDVERQRIDDAINVLQNPEKDLKLFAASICLAKLFHARFCSRKYKTIESIGLSSVESEQVHLAIINIFNPILRIIALNIILNMKDPTIFDEEQRDQVRCSMVDLLQSLVPNLPLIISTFLFVRCYTARQFHPEAFQQMANSIGIQLNESLIDKQNQDSEASYIALRQLNNSDISHFLSEFEKRTNNLSDVLHFNSTVFYQYFSNTSSFNSINTIIPASIYLNELVFDAQILKMYVKDQRPNYISSMEELNGLWEESSKAKKIMTFKVATWITNYLQKPTKEELHQIIENVSRCLLIETKALLVIQKWLNYRMDKELRVFAHYAAIQLFIGGSNIPGLMNIINEMFRIDSSFRLIFIVEHLFISRLANLTLIGQIFVTLQRNIRYSSRISVWIDRKEILELILNFELERITSNILRPEVTSDKPFLSMIRGCSEDFQLYIKEHLCILINIKSELPNNIKHEYIAVVIKWIIESSISYKETENFSMEVYKYIFTLLHDQRFPQTQKAILNALNSVFLFPNTKKANIFAKNDAIINLENFIRLSDTHPEHVLDVFLLAYGNCLWSLNRFQRNRTISDEIKNTLIKVFETSSSEIISIRAAFCLIFAEYSNLNFRTTLNWFKNKWVLTPEKQYKILLQQTLYEVKERSSGSSVQEFVEYLEKHSADLIDMFVIDLYNYLCNKNNSHYLCDPSPAYVNIAAKVSENDLNTFRNAIHKSSFGEKEFKNKLSLYHTNISRYRIASIELYINLGILTNELIGMLEWIGDDEIYVTSLTWRNLKQASDRDVIENFFQLLDLKMSDGKFKSCLDILKSLTKTDVLPLSEVHQRISIIVSVLCVNDDKWRKYELDIFKLLLTLSCFNDEEFLRSFENKFITKSNFDEEFDRQIKGIEECVIETKRLEDVLSMLEDGKSFLTNFEAMPMFE